MEIHKVYFLDHQKSETGLQLRQPCELRFGQLAAPRYQMSIRQIFELEIGPLAPSSGMHGRSKEDLIVSANQLL